MEKKIILPSTKSDVVVAQDIRWEDEQIIIVYKDRKAIGFVYSDTNRDEFALCTTETSETSENFKYFLEEYPQYDFVLVVDE